MKAQVQSHTNPCTMSGEQRDNGIVFLPALQCPAIIIIPPVLHTHISFIRHQHSISITSASFVQQNKNNIYIYIYIYIHIYIHGFFGGKKVKFFR